MAVFFGQAASYWYIQATNALPLRGARTADMLEQPSGSDTGYGSPLWLGV